jgi:hypothetical protein
MNLWSRLADLAAERRAPDRPSTLDLGVPQPPPSQSAEAAVAMGRRARQILADLPPPSPDPPAT